MKKKSCVHWYLFLLYSIHCPYQIPGSNSKYWPVDGSFKDGARRTSEKFFQATHRPTFGVCELKLCVHPRHGIINPFGTLPSCPPTKRLIMRSPDKRKRWKQKRPTATIL
ncbi:unnamed protein product [Sphacelaria rigidula]